MRLTILLIIILLVGTLSCSKEDDQYKIFDGFNIFLLKDENMTANTASKQELSELILQIRPWVSSNNIEYYDYSTHIIYLNNELIISDNTAWDISVYGKPFVVIVNGEKQYLGAIWPGFSSSMFFGPVINVAPRFYPDDIICIQHLLQQSQDLRENYEIRDVLISTGKYHAGLECTIDTIEILDNNQKNNTCTLKYTYTIRNNDIFNLFIFDPDKMESGLFHYFTNGVYLRNENNLYQSTTGYTSPDPWNSWELNWLSLILSGDSITKTVIKTGFPFIPSGSYDCYFRFPGLSHQLSKEERVLPDGRIWIGELNIMKSFDIQFKKSNENLLLNKTN